MSEYVDGEDDDEGKVVFPVPEDGIRYIDAVETACAFSGADLGISLFDDGGNSFADDLMVDVYSLDWDVTFHRAKLIDLLEDELDLCQDQTVEDEESFCESEYEPDDETWQAEYAQSRRLQRLLIRLIRAYHEWQRTDAKYTPDELKVHPLPAVKRPNGAATSAPAEKVEK